MKKKKQKKKEENKLTIVNMIFTICFIVIVGGGGFVTIFRTPKERSYMENRNLEKFTLPTFKTFVRGTFQENLETAMTD